jgi:uncharacterized membrane protein YuzA (DUF378 family)
MDFHGLFMKITEGLVIIGALNWGLVGLLGLDLVSKIFGEGSIISRIIFVLVGLAGIGLLLGLLKVV